MTELLASPLYGYGIISVRRSNNQTATASCLKLKEGTVIVNSNVDCFIAHTETCPLYLLKEINIHSLGNYVLRVLQASTNPCK